MNQLKIINPQKLDGYITKDRKIWKIEYLGRDLSISVDNYLWKIDVIGVSNSPHNPTIDVSHTIHLQINKPIYSPQLDGIRDRNGIPTKVPPIGVGGLPINESGVIDIWVELKGEWHKWSRSPNILKDMDTVKGIIENFID
jgi:hypothetical protein